MLNASGMRFKRLQEVPMGNLIARLVDGTHRIGMVVQAPAFESDVRGALLFSVPSAQVATSMPVFDVQSVNGYGIDFGVKPEVVWSGSLGALTDHTQGAPAVGHLAVVDGVVGLNARVVGRGAGNGPVYWNIGTGEILGFRDSRDVVCIEEWRVGRRDINNEFLELARHPALCTP